MPGVVPSPAVFSVCLHVRLHFDEDVLANPVVFASSTFQSNRIALLKSFVAFPSDQGACCMGERKTLPRRSTRSAQLSSR